MPMVAARSGAFQVLSVFFPRENKRGLSASVSYDRGLQAGGSGRIWDADSAADLTVAEDIAADRIDAEVGYGLPAVGGKLTQTPYLRYGQADNEQDWRLGWRLTSPTEQFETSVEAVGELVEQGSADLGLAVLAITRW